MTPLSFLNTLSSPASVHGAPFGYDLLALIEALETRAKDARGTALYVARDDKAAAAALKLVAFYRPSLKTVWLPGWDVLPYDRVSPSPAVAAARCAGLAELAQRSDTKQPALVITTASSLVQR
ncbi:MAG: transcription-repair coupling factor, partial [Pseudomonadota bacterium]